MTETETTEVELTYRIAARPETIWRFWTDPERICDWWGDSAELDSTAGGVFRVEMGGGPVMRGEYLELVPYERIVFTFGWEVTDGAPWIAPGSTRVEVTLMPDDADTVLTLRHTEIPTDWASEHRSGWEHFLPKLVEAAGCASPDASS